MMISEVPEKIHLLLISGDDATLALTEGLIPPEKYRVTGIAGYDAIVSPTILSGCAVVLLHAGAGEPAALELARNLAGSGKGGPVIILHSSAGDDIEREAASCAAACSLPVSEITPRLLDNAIRHAISHHALTRQLRHLRDQMKGVLEHAPVIFFTTDRNGIFTAMEGRGIVDLGYKTSEVLGRSVFEVYRENPRILRNIVRALAGETFVDLLGGEDLVYECRYTPVRDAAGVVEGIMGVATDLTELTRREGERRRVEERFRAIWESAVDAILLLDADGVLTEANPSFFALSGYSPEEVVGKSIASIFAPDREKFIEDRYRVFFNGEMPHQAYEFPIRRKDGEVRIVEGHVNFIEHNGKRSSMLGIIRDITERKRIEQALRESEEHFRLLIENALDVITVIRADGTIDYESPSLERVLGYKPEELVGQNAFAYIHAEDLPSVLEVFLEAIRYPGRSAGAEFRFLNKNGEWIYLETIGTNLIDHPVIQGVVLNSRNVTERKMAEEALREANDKLETRVRERTAEIEEVMARLEKAHIAQKQFIADASHDLRTPLTVIGIETELLLQTGGHDALTTEGLEVIGREAARMNNLASDLLLLATLDSPRSNEVYHTIRFDEFLLELIKQMTALASEKGISWNIQVGDPVEYRCDTRMMESALTNVLENAIKYSHAGGVVDVSMQVNDESIVIEVADRGIGIPADEVEKVFERFYRSDVARSTPGTGLGLAIVKAVIDAHHGSIRLESEKGEGTRVKIWLPRSSSR